MSVGMFCHNGMFVNEFFVLLFRNTIEALREDFGIVRVADIQ